MKQERPGGAGRGSVEFSSGQGTEEGGEERRATPRAWGGGTNPGAWRGNAKGALRRQGRRHRGWGWGNEKRRKCARGEFAGKGRGQPGGAKQAEAKVGGKETAGGQGEYGRLGGLGKRGATRRAAGAGRGGGIPTPGGGGGRQAAPETTKLYADPSPSPGGRAEGARARPAPAAGPGRGARPGHAPAGPARRPPRCPGTPAAAGCARAPPRTGGGGPGPAAATRREAGGGATQPEFPTFSPGPDAAGADGTSRALPAPPASWSHAPGWGLPREAGPQAGRTRGTDGAGRRWPAGGRRRKRRGGGGGRGELLEVFPGQLED